MLHRVLSFGDLQPPLPISRGGEEKGSICQEIIGIAYRPKFSGSRLALDGGIHNGYDSDESQADPKANDGIHPRHTFIFRVVIQ